MRLSERRETGVTGIDVWRSQVVLGAPGSHLADQLRQVLDLLGVTIYIKRHAADDQDGEQ